MSARLSKAFDTLKATAKVSPQLQREDDQKSLPIHTEDQEGSEFINAYEIPC